MRYSLVDEHSSCDAFTQLMWGTLENIANGLINECYELIGNMTIGMDDEEIEELYSLNDACGTDCEMKYFVPNEFEDDDDFED